MHGGQLQLVVDLRLVALLLVQVGDLVVAGHQIPGELDHVGVVEVLRQQMLMLGESKDAEVVLRSSPAFSLPQKRFLHSLTAPNRALV